MVQQGVLYKRTVQCVKDYSGVPHVRPRLIFKIRTPVILTVVTHRIA
jgi:hypothetical protein